jgi:hypothetical protein
MKRIVVWLVLLCLFPSLPTTRGEEVKPAILSAVEQVEAELAEFDQTKKISNLETAIFEMNRLKPPFALTTAEYFQKRKKRTQLWFKVAAVIERNKDPKWNPNDGAHENIPSPIGVSGVDPKAVKDPALRAEYEAALKKNEVKGKRSLYEYRLRQLEGHVALYIGLYAAGNYAKSAKNDGEFDELLQTSKLSEARKRELKESIRKWQGRVETKD